MHKIIKAMTCFALGCSVLFSHNVFADDEINVPASVQATYINKISETNNGIKIRWKKQNVSYYEVYRSTKKYKNYKLIKTINGSTNNLTDNNVKANTAYYYKVKCYLGSEDFPNNNTSDAKNMENSNSIIGTAISSAHINTIYIFLHLFIFISYPLNLYLRQSSHASPETMGKPHILLRNFGCSFWLLQKAGHKHGR